MTSSGTGPPSSRSSATFPTARTISRSSPAGGTCNSSPGLYACRKRASTNAWRCVELSDAADVPVRGYSLGMRRKLLLARALLHRPRCCTSTSRRRTSTFTPRRVVHASSANWWPTARTVLLDHAQHAGSRRDLRPGGHPLSRQAGRARLAAGPAATARANTRWT